MAEKESLKYRTMRIPLPEVRTEEEAVSPSVDALLQNAIDRGWIKEAIFGRLNRGVEGFWYPRRKTMEVYGANQGLRDRVALHELVHVLQDHEEAGQLGRIAKQIAANQEEGYDLNPFSALNRLYRSMKADEREAGKRRANEVVRAIPEGEAWSGMKHGNAAFFGREVDPYYFTLPELRFANRDRYREFGKRLIKYEFPIRAVQNVIRLLENKIGPEG